MQTTRDRNDIDLRLAHHDLRNAVRVSPIFGGTLRTIPHAKDIKAASTFQRLPLMVGSLIFILLLAGCAADSFSVLVPGGPAAARIAELWWLLLGLGTAIFLLVMAALGMALFRRRRPEQTVTGGSTHTDNRVILWAGMIGPAIILISIFAFSVKTMAQLSSLIPDDEFVVHVIGHQWWWEVRYPNQVVATANEIHIPVGQPVSVRLSTQDVIHNFWIPNLHGKMDMVPGQTNEFWIQADRAGEYWGECAEFCGIQHAKMRFVVVAEPVEQFTAWIEHQRLPAAPPDARARPDSRSFWVRPVSIAIRSKVPMLVAISVPISPISPAAVHWQRAR